MLKFIKLLPRYADMPDLSGSDSMANTAKSTGENAINSFDPGVTAGAQQKKLGDTGLGGLLGGETNNYVNNFAKSIPGIYDTANAKYNVPQLADTATGLQNRLTNAVPDAYKGARGYDIDSTDINNGIASKTAYLTPQSNAATNNFNTASGLAQNYVNTAIQPFNQEGTLLAGQEGAQATGWNNASQSEFQGLMDKMNAGVTLSASEMSRANTLAQMEEDYQAKTQAAKIANQYQVIPQNSNLVNTFTNSVLNPTIANPKGMRVVK